MLDFTNLVFTLHWSLLKPLNKYPVSRMNMTPSDIPKLALGSLKSACQTSENKLICNINTFTVAQVFEFNLGA